MPFCDSYWPPTGLVSTKDLQPIFQEYWETTGLMSHTTKSDIRNIPRSEWPVLISEGVVEAELSRSQTKNWVTQNQSSPWLLLLSITKVPMENGQGWRFTAKEPALSLPVWVAKCASTTEPHCPSAGILVGVSTQDALLWRRLLRIKPIHTLDVRGRSLKGRTLY